MGISRDNNVFSRISSEPEKAYILDIDAVDPHNLDQIKQYINEQEKVSEAELDSVILLWYLTNMSPSYFSPTELEARNKILEQRDVTEAEQVERMLENLNSPDLFSSDSLARIAYLARINCTNFSENKPLQQRVVLAVEKEMLQFFQDHESVFTGSGNVVFIDFKNKNLSFQTIDLWRYLYGRGLLDRSIFMTEDEKKNAEEIVADYILSTVQNRLNQDDIYKKDFEKEKKLLLSQQISLIGKADIRADQEVGFQLFLSVNGNFNGEADVNRSVQMASPLQFGWYDMPKRDLRISGLIIERPDEQTVRNCFNELAHVLAELILKGMPISCKITMNLDDAQFNSFLIYGDFDAATSICKGMQDREYRVDGKPKLISEEGVQKLYPFGDFLITIRGTGEAEYDKTVIEDQLVQIQDCLSK